MKAEIITVGTEILLGEIVNTNSRFLAGQLAQLGIDLYHQITVGDNLSRATESVRQALERADLVITTGGLGPTDDDLTREAVCGALGIDLLLDPEQLKVLEEHFSRRGQSMPANNIKQAMIPRGALILPNPNGTACGSAVISGGKMVILLPGPPWELEPMFSDFAVPLLKQHFSLKESLYTRTLRFFAIGESKLETELMDILRGQTDPTMALYAKLGETEIRLASKAVNREIALARMQPVIAQIQHLVGDYLYGFDNDSLEGVVANLLSQKKLSLSTAESCTGGLIAHKMTNIPGSSSFFNLGFITYSNAAKQSQLGVPEETLNEFGAVSSETVTEMARGARRVAQADLALAVSGIAGPGGGTATKPVGLVYVALSSETGEQVIKLQLRGQRDRIKELSSKYALYLLYCHLVGKTVNSNLVVKI